MNDINKKRMLNGFFQEKMNKHYDIFSEKCKQDFRIIDKRWESRRKRAINILKDLNKGKKYSYISKKYGITVYGVRFIEEKINRQMYDFFLQHYRQI